MMKIAIVVLLLMFATAAHAETSAADKSTPASIVSNLLERIDVAINGLEARVEGWLERNFGPSDGAWGGSGGDK